MNHALRRFESEVLKASDHLGLHEVLNGLRIEALDYDDLLRFHIVQVVSAFDRFLHDVITNGIVEIFLADRSPTDKYLNESLPLSLVHDAGLQSLPPQECVFRDYISRKLKCISFQHPDKVADGLSYIWSERHKWQRIAAEMGCDPKNLRKKMILIVSRRNCIVHESDINVDMGEKNDISKEECLSATELIYNCGLAIFNLVK